MLAACLVAQGTPEPAAVMYGWVESIHGPLEPVSLSALYDEPTKWITQLPEVLGAHQFATLHASGAAMTAEGILEFAHAQIEDDGAHRGSPDL